MQSVVDSGNYILSLNKINAEVIGIDYRGENVIPKLSNKTSRIVYIGDSSRAETFGITLPFSIDINGITKGINQSFVKIQSFNDLITPVWGSVDLKEFMPDKDENKYAATYTKYKNKTGTYDYPTWIARTAIHEVAHQLFTGGDEHTDDTKTPSRYNLEDINYAFKKTNLGGAGEKDILKVWGFFLLEGLIKLENGQWIPKYNIMKIGGRTAVYRFPKETKNGEMLRFIPVDLFIVRQFFQYGITMGDMEKACNNKLNAKEAVAALRKLQIQYGKITIKDTLYTKKELYWTKLLNRNMINKNKKFR